LRRNGKLDNRVQILWKSVLKSNQQPICCPNEKEGKKPQENGGEKKGNRKDLTSSVFLPVVHFPDEESQEWNVLKLKFKGMSA